MAKKTPKIRVPSARSSSKLQEKELLARARTMRNNPEKVVPECVNRDHCSLAHHCPIDQLVVKMRKVQGKKGENKDKNEVRLGVLSKKGDKFLRAYAGALLLASKGSVPTLKNFSHPAYGSLKYAHRGSAPDNIQAGLQNYHDVKGRQLAYLDIVKTRKLHTFSGPDGMFCSGTESRPPKKFVTWLANRVTAKVTTKDGRVFNCAHLEPSDVKKSRSGGDPYLRITWEDGDAVIGICQACAARHQDNSLAIALYLLPVKIESFFTAEVIHTITPHPAVEEDLVFKPPSVPRSLRKSYYKLEITDEAFIEGYTSKVTEVLEESGELMFVHGTTWFGTDREAFIANLRPLPTDEEAQVLDHMLKNLDEPLVVEKTTPHKLISRLWEDHALSALKHLLKDKKLARQYHERYESENVSTSQWLKQAVVASKEKNLLSQLPELDDDVPEVARTADSLTRVHLTKGRQGLVQRIEKLKTSDTKAKSVAYAMLLSVGADSGRDWRFSTNEIDFAQYLREDVDLLLTSTPENYLKRLQKVVRSSGSTHRLMDETEEE